MVVEYSDDFFKTKTKLADLGRWFRIEGDHIFIAFKEKSEDKGFRIKVADNRSKTYDF